jgi:hypothetical protein
VSFCLGVHVQSPSRRREHNGLSVVGARTVQSDDGTILRSLPTMGESDYVRYREYTIGRNPPFV